VLTNVRDLVEKVEDNRYDAALHDTLRALVTVYGDPDPISVQQDDNGALNIEVKSQPGMDPIYDDQLFKKTSPFKTKRFGGHGKSATSANDDIGFVSPI
jgi:hypothetical protein